MVCLGHRGVQGEEGDIAGPVVEGDTIAISRSYRLRIQAL